jgi:glycosyltransferase involved in cell wall biosynthesis
MAAQVGEAPLVSCLVATYNYGEFVERAVRSALDQDYPPDRLEIVVVDDGSTDDTPQRLDEIVRAAAGRVRAFRQENAGPTLATSRAIAEARGELLAVLDADDMWPPGKTRAQVELLERRPDAALAYTDMTVVDESDQMVHESFFEAFGVEPLEGRPLASLLVKGNFATASSIMFRSALRDAVHPIPAEVPYGDWWLAARASQFGELAYLATERTTYRLHSENISLGARGEQEVREQRKFTAFRRLFLRYLRRGDMPAGEMLDVCEWIAEAARSVTQRLGVALQDLLPVTYDERRAATALAANARSAARSGDLDAAAALIANSLGNAIDSEPAHDVMRELRALLPA